MCKVYWWAIPNENTPFINTFAPPESTLVLSTLPTNAEIYIDNAFVGHSTLTHNVLPGTYNIVARLPDHDETRMSITVTGHETEDIVRHILLTPIQSPPPSPTPTPTPSPSPTSALRPSVGQIIEFGDHDWRILDIQGSYALIITENIIEYRVYHDRDEDVTWELSSIRQYLNSEFYSRFSHPEQARIRQTMVINNVNPWFEVINPWVVSLTSENNTNDRIFLLSVEEVVRYFGDSRQLQNIPERNSMGSYWISDSYNNARIAVGSEGAASWWLRTMAIRYNENFINAIPRVIRVGAHGDIDMAGSYATRILFDGGGNRGGGVRPALWLNLEP